MALKDLIQQAKQSKLGRAISNLDRDKEQAGFQFTAPNSFVRQGIQRVQQSLKEDPGQYSITRGFANIVPTTQAVLSPINFLRRQEPSQFAKDISFGLRGASQFTPFQAINSLGIDKTGQKLYQQTAPTTQRELNAQQVGRTLYGTALSAPIGGASKAVNVVRNITTPTVAGAILSPAITTAGKFLTKRETPTGQELLESAKQGAFQGFKSAPVLAFTNPITSRVVGSYVSQMGGSGLVNQAVQRSIGGVANLFEDEIIAKTDGLTPTSHERLLSLALGALMTGNNFKQFEDEARASGVSEANISKFEKQARSQVTGRYIKSGTQEQLQPKVFASGNIEDPNLTLQPRQGGRGLELQPKSKSRLEEMRKTQGGFIDFGAEVDLKPKTRLQNQIADLEAKGYTELEANRQVAQIAQEKRSMFSESAIKDIDRIKILARSKAFLEGDIETLRKKDPKLVDRVVESVREALGDERMSDEDALQYAIELPNKGATTVKTPEPLKEARELKQKAKEVKDLVFNSETDLKVKEKAIKDNSDILSKDAISDFKEWEKQLAKQEGLKTGRGQATRNLNQILTNIKQGTVPSYIQHKNIQKLKDIKNIDIGLKDVNRNFETVFGKNSDAEKRLLKPFDTSKAKMVDDKNRIADELDKNIVQKYGFKQGSRESAAIQQFGEGNRDYASLVNEFGETKAKNIVESDKWFRSKYNQLLDEVNTVRQRIYPGQVDKIIPKRKDYYRHFVEMQEGFAGLKNLFDTPANISPSLSGVSANTKPKSKWLSFAQQRLGNKTTEDAIGGFIEYANAQTYAKHIDPHVAEFRGFTDQLREQMETYKGDAGKLNNFIEFMDDFTNDLAGKTNPADRAIQKYIPGGRKTFAVLNWINNRTKANVIVGNLSSAVAQFFNIPQGVAEAGPVASAKGLLRSFAGLVGNNKEIGQSEFVKTRYGDDAFDRFDTGALASTKKLAVWITSIGDKIGTRYIWNSLYEKALANGIENPVKYADDYTRKMVAGRGIGEVPVLQKAKTFQLVAPFQLEVANIWHVMNDWAGEKAAGKFVTFFVASHIMNKIAKEVRGSDVSLDPIQAFYEAYNTYQNEEDKKTGVIKAGGRLGGEVLSNIPGGQSVASLYDEYGTGALGTVVKGITGETITRKELFGEGDPTRFGGGLLATKALQDPLYKLVPSFGGEQIKRTIQGIQAVNRGTSESKKGLVRTPIQKTAENYIRGALFGQYSIPEVRDFFDKNRTVLGEKQTEQFKQILTQQGPQAAQTFYDSIMATRTIESDKTKLKEKISSGSSVDTSKLPTKEAIDLIKTKIEAGLEVNQQELETAYLSNTLTLPTSNRYEKAQKDSKLWSSYGTIESNENLSDTQKQALYGRIARELGRPVEDLQKYQVAKDDNNNKTLYTLDQIDKMQSPQELLTYLKDGRKPINGKILVSDGVIDNLVSDGIIPYQLGKELKNLDFNEDGSLKKKKVSGGKAKKSARSKAIDNYLANLSKITLPSGKIRTQAPINISVKGLTFSD